ncbi:MAG TPA: hypothetical protein VK894_00100 [Jiangellales bacterium]|nr:hypothetical protein [Jiangellales bacterium]
MRAGRHRARGTSEAAEDLAAGVVLLPTDDLDVLLDEARTEEESLGYAEELFSGRLDLALAEADRRGMDVPREPDGAGFDTEVVALVQQGLPGLAERSDAEIRAAVGVLQGHLDTLRSDLERVRGLVRVAGDERARRHG